MRAAPAYLLAVSIAGLLLISSCVTRNFTVTENYQEPQTTTQYTTQPYTENETAILSSETGQFRLTSFYNWNFAYMSFEGSPFVYYSGYEVPDWASYDDIRLRLTLQPQMQYERAIVRLFDVTRTGQLPSPTPLPPVEETANLPPEESPTGLPSKFAFQGDATEFWLNAANSWVGQSKFIGAARYPLSTFAGPQEIVFRVGQPASIAVLVSGPYDRWNGAYTLDALWTRNTVEVRQVARERQVPKQVTTQVQKQRAVAQSRQVPFWQAIISP